MIVYHLENCEWVKINLKQAMVPFTQGACVSVILSPQKKVLLGTTGNFEKNKGQALS